jgi:hypothetical protein
VLTLARAKRVPLRKPVDDHVGLVRNRATKCLCERSSTFQCSRQSMNARSCSCKICN